MAKTKDGKPCPFGAKLKFSDGDMKMCGKHGKEKDSRDDSKPSYDELKAQLEAEKEKNKTLEQRAAMAPKELTMTMSDQCKEALHNIKPKLFATAKPEFIDVAVKSTADSCVVTYSLKSKAEIEAISNSFASVLNISEPTVKRNLSQEASVCHAAHPLTLSPPF